MERRTRWGRVVGWVVTALTAVAVAQQLRTPAAERTWHGHVGPVPYDFRPPTPERFRDAWWNPDDPRIFPPRDFGLGWAVNLGRVVRLLQRAAGGYSLRA